MVGPGMFFRDPAHQMLRPSLIFLQEKLQIFLWEIKILILKTRAYLGQGQWLNQKFLQIWPRKYFLASLHRRHIGSISTCPTGELQHVLWVHMSSLGTPKSRTPIPGVEDPPGQVAFHWDSVLQPEKQWSRGSGSTFWLLFIIYKLPASALLWFGAIIK